MIVFYLISPQPSLSPNSLIIPASKSLKILVITRMYVQNNGRSSKELPEWRVKLQD